MMHNDAHAYRNWAQGLTEEQLISSMSEIRAGNLASWNLNGIPTSLQLQKQQSVNLLILTEREEAADLTIDLSRQLVLLFVRYDGIRYPTY